MALGKTVTVIEEDVDRYARVVGAVILPDGRNLNREILAAGLAWWYRQYAPDDTVARILESKARKDRRGLWAEADPVPPWEWRKQDHARPRSNLRRSEPRSQRRDQGRRR